MNPLHSDSLCAAIQMQAQQLGFDLCQFAPVAEALHADFFEAWLGAGRHGEMEYLARAPQKRRSPRLLTPASEADYRTMIVLAVDHHQLDLAPAIRADPSRGLIASYAWGDDYHELVRPLLYELDAFIRARTGRTTLGKCLVDTGPVLERDWALRAGVGFTGKNCCTIHPGMGSWLLLATILIPEELVDESAGGETLVANVTAEQVLAGLPDDGHYGSWFIPLASSRPNAQPRSKSGAALATCGRCTRCLDACPTDAFVGPYHLNPERCISYWTIETQSPIPHNLRPRFGNRIFGCDICQEVCPYNQRMEERHPRIAGLAAQTKRMAPPLLEGFATDRPYWLNDEIFALHFRRSPIKRAGRCGMLRNVCVALGNWGDPCILPALTTAIDDAHPAGRGHAAWALGQVLRRHGMAAASQPLLSRLAIESDDWVRREIASALNV